MYTLNPITRNILLENGTSKDRYALRDVVEEAAVKIDNEMVNKLYGSALNKKHLDFGSIEKSAGNITKFEGYAGMTEVLSCIKSLNGGKYFEDLETVEKAVDNIRGLAPQFELGFRLRKEFVMLTYNTMVMACVVGTSSLISAYVEYVKNPEATVPVIRENPKEPDRLVIDNLKKFNDSVNKGEMIKVLSAINKSGKEGFLGEAIAIPVAIIGALLAIIPTLRLLIHYFFYGRMKLSEYLKYEALMLEINKSSVEANNTFNASKKKSILKKQQKWIDELNKISDKIKVSSVEAEKKASADIKKEDKMYTLDNMKPAEPAKNNEPKKIDGYDAEFDDSDAGLDLL